MAPTGGAAAPDRVPAVRFRFWAADSPPDRPHFAADLISERCRGRTACGRRCRRRVARSLPLCWLHLLRDGRLRLAPSRFGGTGLFAAAGRWWRRGRGRAPAGAVVFRPGELIAPYLGEPVCPVELGARYGGHTAPYVLDWVDGARYRSAAAMCNTHLNPRCGVRSSVRHCNAAFRYLADADEFWLAALVPIRDGEEVLAYYGSGYRIGADGSRHTTVRCAR